MIQVLLDGLDRQRRLRNMGISKRSRRKSSVKRYDRTASERDTRAELSAKTEGFLRDLFRSPPRRTGGNPG